MPHETETESIFPEQIVAATCPTCHGMAQAIVRHDGHEYRSLATSYAPQPATSLGEAVEEAVERLTAWVEFRESYNAPRQLDGDLRTVLTALAQSNEARESVWALSVVLAHIANAELERIVQRLSVPDIDRFAAVLAWYQKLIRERDASRSSSPVRSGEHA